MKKLFLDDVEDKENSRPESEFDSPKIDELVHLPKFLREEISTTDSTKNPLAE